VSLNWALKRTGIWVKRELRLTRSTDFKRVRTKGKAYTHPLMVLIALPGEGPGLKIGFAAGRSVGKAVVRNRAKRRLREAVFSILPMLPVGWYLVFVARGPIRDAKYDQIQAGVHRVLHKAGLWMTNDGGENG
jgi:ribonuclease P protein component